MSIVLQILGAIFLLLIIFLVVVVLFVRSKLKNLARTLEGMTKTLAASGTPARIHLTEMAIPDWENEEAVEAITRELPGLGFERVWTYQVQEIPGLALQAWINPGSATTAIVYEHPVAEVWLDFVTRYQDGTRVTFANTSAGEGVDHAPGHDVQRHPGLEPRELYEKFLAHRPADKPMEPVSAVTFAAVFQKAYADEMDWRNSRGGATPEEIRAIADLSGGGYSEEILAATSRMAEQRASAQLEESLRERFLTESGISAAEWERVRDRVLVVHDRMDREFLEAAIEGLSPSGDGAGPLLGGTPRQAFAALNAGLPAEKRFTRLGGVREPVEADVYAAPEP
jgi:hypothetical protein